jgi:hypothetical protein
MLCRTQRDYFQLWEQGRGPGQVTAASGTRGRRIPVSAPDTVAVVVISHNYGHFLAEALDSVLAQSRPADEIVVLDDDSDDDTGEVARSYAERGVRLLRVEVRNVHLARKAGFEATSSAALCFLDADDRLTRNYLEQGLREFSSPCVAVAYSDVQQFGAKRRRSSYPATFDAGLLAHDNYIHAGSLVRREALEDCRVFELTFDPRHTQGDWFLWRRVLTGRWTARKQTGVYLYRQHNRNWTGKMKKSRPSAHYFHYAGLTQEVLTLFVPLAGRTVFWPQTAAFLGRQAWPHAQVRLVLLDTSQSEAFSRTVRRWIGGCDYGDVRHLQQSVGTAGIADDNRRESGVRSAVVRSMRRIYNRLLSLAETEYVWVLEDDIIPPDDVCERLLKGFDAKTASVAAPYRSRYHADYVVWKRDGRAYAKPGRRLERVGGNGFGCTILRRSVLHDHVFAPLAAIEDYDTAFYRRLQSTPYMAQVDWTCECQHLSREPAAADM